MACHDSRRFLREPETSLQAAATCSAWQSKGEGYNWAYKGHQVSNNPAVEQVCEWKQRLKQNSSSLGFD